MAAPAPHSSIPIDPAIPASVPAPALLPTLAVRMPVPASLEFSLGGAATQSRARCAAAHCTDPCCDTAAGSAPPTQGDGATHGEKLNAWNRAKIETEAAGAEAAASYQTLSEDQIR